MLLRREVQLSICGELREGVARARPRALVKILIVDEQAQARNNLIRLCERSDDVQVVGEAASGMAAIDAAGTLNPDLMLLDVELPDMSGFEVLRALRGDARPLGIIVSPCADHAISAFAEGAIDFFVMPVTTERFDLAMARARHQCNGSFPAELGRAAQFSPRFLVGERQRRLYPLDPKSIDYIEADGNYVTLRAGTVEYLSRNSIKRLSALLGDLGFIRIERSLLVNAAAVSYAEVAGHGTFALTLGSGVCLHSSAGYRDSILRIIPLPGLSKRYRGTAS
jgi:two-component system, LytTR family, response regulator